MTSRRRSGGGVLTRVAVVLVVVVLAVVAISAIPGAVGNRVSDLLSSLNPFDEETVDRTGPSVLVQLTEMSDYKAATGYYETVVDIEDGEGGLPGFLSGERVIYVGKGEVDAFVDFSELDERRIETSVDETSVRITLPAPTLEEPRLDLESSEVVDRDRGLIDRFRGSDLERRAQQTAVRQMAAAATGNDNLVDLAESSTTTMLRGLFGSLGYTDVEVEFDDSQDAGDDR